MKTKLAIRSLLLLAISSFIYMQPLAAQRRGGSAEPQKSANTGYSTQSNSGRNDGRTNEPSKNQPTYNGNQTGQVQNGYNQANSRPSGGNQYNNQADNRPNGGNQHNNNQGYYDNRPNGGGYGNGYNEHRDNGQRYGNRNDSYKYGYINEHAARCVYMRPPAPRVEYQQRYDRPGYVWVEGYWDWDQRMRAYYWVDGYWARTRVGYAYYSGYWEPYRGGYIWIEGGWFIK